MHRLEIKIGFGFSTYRYPVSSVLLVKEAGFSQMSIFRYFVSNYVAVDVGLYSHFLFSSSDVQDNFVHCHVAFVMKSLLYKIKQSKV